MGFAAGWRSHLHPPLHRERFPQDEFFTGDQRIRDLYQRCMRGFGIVGERNPERGRVRTVMEIAIVKVDRMQAGPLAGKSSERFAGSS